MNDIYGFTRDALAQKLIDIGEKPSRADIIFPALYGELITDLSGLPLKKESIERISDNFTVSLPETLNVLTSDGADKYLFGLSDGNTVESVLMKHEFGYNVCVSTQVGCNMGCRFCVSGQLKKIRDLTVPEIVGQVVRIQQKLDTKITGISVMGIGEPLENLKNVLTAVSILTHPKGFGIGIKHITLSTCGIVPGIYELADSVSPVNLAVSLHAPDDELRKSIMPVTGKYPIKDVVDAARYYSEKNNRRITFEYVMLDGVNDSGECARKLSELLSGMNCYVNIIRYNSSADSPYSCSPHERIMDFYDILKKNGIGVTMRRELGASVSAACGQLRANNISYQR